MPPPRRFARRLDRVQPSLTPNVLLIRGDKTSAAGKQHRGPLIMMCAFSVGIGGPLRVRYFKQRAADPSAQHARRFFRVALRARGACRDPGRGLVMTASTAAPLRTREILRSRCSLDDAGKWRSLPPRTARIASTPRGATFSSARVPRAREASLWDPVGCATKSGIHRAFPRTLEPQPKPASCIAVNGFRANPRVFCPASPPLGSGGVLTDAGRRDYFLD